MMKRSAKSIVSYFKQNIPPEKVSKSLTPDHCGESVSLGSQIEEPFRILDVLNRLKLSPTASTCSSERQTLTKRYILPQSQESASPTSSMLRKVDDVSVKILQLYEPVKLQDFVPIQVTGDGNCLYRTLSLHLYGTEEQHTYLRILTAFELLEYQSRYDFKSPSYCPVVDYPENIEFTELVQSAITNGSYSDIHHVYALSAAIKIPIESFCPSSESSDSQHMYTKTVNGRGVLEYLEDSQNSLKPAAIMWTMLSVPEQRSSFRTEANHIVYLARVPNWSSVPPSIPSDKRDSSVVSGIGIVESSDDSNKSLPAELLMETAINNSAKYDEACNISSTSQQRDQHEKSSRIVSTFPKVCRNEKQFQAWQKSRNWLSLSSDGKVICTTCSQVKSLGVCSERGVRLDSAFCDGTVVAKDAKTLLKKLDKHRDTNCHKKCGEILLQREQEKMKEGFVQLQSLFEEQNKSRIEATCALFRTAYECAKSHLSFTEYSRLINLQILNGLQCGTVGHSDHYCASIIEHVAKEMVKELVTHIVVNECKFSILIDESTSVSNVQNLIVYIRTLFESNVYVYFLGLIPLEVATAKAIFDKLLVFLNEIGLSEEILQKQLIGFGSDGASCMTGQFKGVATLLNNIIPNLKAIHCMAHRLELAIRNAADDVNYISYFRDLVDCIYKVYSTSPKNQRELDDVAASLAIHILKVKRVFDVRWVFSSYTAVTALWNNFSALFLHFDQLSKDSSRTSKERSKFLGLTKKLQSLFFLKEVAMLRDALSVLKQFSHFLQSDQASVTVVHLQIESLKEKLLCLKNGKGQFLKEFEDSFNETGKFQNVAVITGEGDEERFSQTKSQFYQALQDNIAQRFPCDSLLKDALVLNEINFPSDPIQLALYGDKEIVSLCNCLSLDSKLTCDILTEYTLFKKTKARGKLLTKLLHQVETYPLSTAACERGFSQTNLCHTKSRNSLSSETVSSLLMVNINGPPLSRWNAKKYVISWLKSGHKSALDKPSRCSVADETVSASSGVFS